MAEGYWRTGRVRLRGVHHAVRRESPDFTVCGQRPTVFDSPSTDVTCKHCRTVLNLRPAVSESLAPTEPEEV